MFQKTGTKGPRIRKPETFMGQDKNTYGEEMKEGEGKMRAHKTNSRNFPIFSTAALVLQNETEQP